MINCARAILVVPAVFDSVSEIDWSTGNGTCVKWSIGPTWINSMYAHVLILVYVKSCQI